MKTLNLALVTLAVATTLAGSAFARDGIASAQGGSTSYTQSADALVVAPATTAAPSSAESFLIQHNALGNR
jgi:hypothetical protein